jgi:outer membrane protein assembly factor BamB
MRIFCLVLTLAASGSGLAAQSWQQWRGPTRDGVVTGASVPASWPAAVRRVWRIDVGEGYSSPVEFGGRVFVHSRSDPDEMVTAVDLESGKVLWQEKYAAPFAKNQYAVRMAKGPNSTPVVTGEQLVTLGATGVLTAWRVKDGGLVWRNDYSSSVDTSKLFCGTSMSPLLEGGALIVYVGSDVHGGRVIALDPATGTERWTWRGPGPGYASPIAFTASGVRQLVTMTNESIVGIDARSGASLWSTPFPDDWHENIVTPIWTGSHVIVRGVRQGTHALSLSIDAGKWTATRVWSNPDVAMYMSAPVFFDGTLYGMSSRRKGQFVAIDAATGTVRWATEGREGDHASVLLAPAHVLFLTNAGDFVVARRDASTFTAERRIEVADGESWAVPVLVPGGMVIRDGQGLVRVAWGS